MNKEDISIRKLEGPFSSHLYIGFAPANKNIVHDLCAKLEKQGVICYLRDQSVGIKESIREGVRTSQKCLLFLTSDYMKDKWYQMETSTVVDKSERFSRDVVITLTGGDLYVMPERLREFTRLTFILEKFNDEKLFAQFVDFITREPKVNLAVLSKQNIGYGSACSYFYGFLRLVLPDFKKRLIEETLKNDPEDVVQKTVQKMLIIMPESCFCATKLDSPNRIEFTGKFVFRFAHRAGNQKRDFKSSLYKLIDDERQQEYYFAGELATPLLTMYETQYFGVCGMTKDQLYAERDVFYCTLKAILSHPDNAECNDRFKLLYWPDPPTEKANTLDLYKFLLPVLREEILLQRQNEGNPSIMGTTSNVRSLSKNPPLLPTFEHVPVDGSNPARIYDAISQYPMDRRPRGRCLIVNIANFEKGHRHLLPRRGAEKDAELLKKLFEYLHFEVQVENDVDAQTLETLFLTMHIIDHTNHDAFVCCIMSHGRLGVIYTSDGKPVEILSLVDFFTDRNCPSLKGKPKMFFIQACQTGGPESESGAISNIAMTEVERAIEEDGRSDPTLSMLDDTLPTIRKHKAVLVPGSPDFLMSYSTLPWSLSYRERQTGSLYIQALNDCLRKDTDVESSLKMVSYHVKEKLREQEEHDGVPVRFQLPFHLTSGMDRLIYL